MQEEGQLHTAAVVLSIRVEAVMMMPQWLDDPFVASAKALSVHTGAPHTEAPQTGAPHTEAPQTGAPHTGGQHTEALHTGALVDPCKTQQLGNQKKLGLVQLLHCTVALGHHALCLDLFLGLGQVLSLCWILHLHIDPAYQTAAVQMHVVEAAVQQVDVAEVAALVWLQELLEG